MIMGHLSSGQIPTRVNQVVWPMDVIVAFPAMFWAGVWLRRRQPLGYVVAAILLVKACLLGVTLVVTTWITTIFWNGAADPIVPHVCSRRLWWTGAGSFVPVAPASIWHRYGT